MAIKRPDIYENNNPNYAIADSNFVRGGFRTEVADLTALYALDPTPSAPDQFKEHATIVYVVSMAEYYVLKDIANIGNVNGWEIFSTGGGSGAITGATNGLTLTNGVIKLGGILTGATVFSNNTLNYAADYSSSYTARSLPDKAYVDSIATGLHVKKAVNVATTTSNITLSGLVSSPLDGITLQNGWRILVKNQTAGWQNGIYIVNSGGVWNRASDMDFTPTGETIQGSYMYVLTGATNQGTSWVLTTPDPIVSGDTLTFELFNHVADVVAGTGITVTSMGGTYVISVNGSSLAGNSITWSGLTFNVNVNSGTLSTALNSKLKVSDFNVYSGLTKTEISSKASAASLSVYTGTTAPALLNGKASAASLSVYTGTTAPALFNAKTTQSNLAIYTGTTAPALLNLKTTQSNLAIYTGTTATAINLKTTQSNLDLYTGNTATALTLKTTQSNLAIYTGTTATAINLKTTQANLAVYTGLTRTELNLTITGGTNGLSKFGRKVCLGGALTQNTNISGSSSYSFSLTCLSAFNLGFCTGGGVVTDDSPTPRGLRYSQNYCSGFVNRSLVDAAYVTGYTQSFSNVIPIRIVNYSGETISTEDRFIGVSGLSTSWVCEIKLPISPKCGQIVSISDIKGNALSNIIKICGNGKCIIGTDPFSPAIINSDYGSITLVYLGQSIGMWSAIAFNN